MHRLQEALPPSPTSPPACLVALSSSFASSASAASATSAISVVSLAKAFSCSSRKVGARSSSLWVAVLNLPSELVGGRDFVKIMLKSYQI